MRCGLARLGVAGMSHNSSEICGTENVENGWIEGRDVVVQPKMERKREIRREWAKRVCMGSWELNWNFDGGLGLGCEFSEEPNDWVCMAVRREADENRCGCEVLCLCCRVVVVIMTRSPENPIIVAGRRWR